MANFIKICRMPNNRMSDETSPSDEVITSKVQTFEEAVKDGIVLFEVDKFPKLLNNNYDCLPFILANVAFKMKNNMRGFFTLIEPFVELYQEKNIFVLEDIKVNELRKELVQKKALHNLSVFEIIPKDAAEEHSDLLRSMGADFDFLKITETKSVLGLKNYKELISGKFDITFSNWLLHDTSGIEQDTHSNVFRSMEMLALFANITKVNGYSIHARGSYISTLYETFLDLLGFRIVKYFRVASGPYNFVMVLKKYNSKETSPEEFEYIYKTLLSKNPNRYRL
jgi:hypothetical protein